MRRAPLGDNAGISVVGVVLGRDRQGGPEPEPGSIYYQHSSRESGSPARGEEPAVPTVPHARSRHSPGPTRQGRSTVLSMPPDRTTGDRITSDCVCSLALLHAGSRHAPQSGNTCCTISGGELPPTRNPSMHACHALACRLRPACASAHGREYGCVCMHSTRVSVCPPLTVQSWHACVLPVARAHLRASQVPVCHAGSSRPPLPFHGTWAPACCPRALACEPRACVLHGLSRGPLGTRTCGHRCPVCCPLVCVGCVFTRIYS